ncbi:tail fiber protein [Desulfovibrio piger]|uniref:tail fiber protein n=1 Tax=Desulfovibrio piger TaxID=901 RepID=UPI00197FF629|nr:tail fiber protein [Desulfovibrio piger]
MAFPNLLKRLFDTNGAGVTLRGDIMPFSAEAPKAGGTASAGTSNTVARGDHVHPAQTIGTASGTVSGTTKLSDATNSTSGADSGVAATPKAVKAAYDKAVEAKNAADAAASSIDPWNIFPMRVPIAVDGVTFGGSDGRRAIMPGETVARENWIICDGGSDGNGGSVPNLLGRMILGASDSVPAGSTGGSETHTHSISGTVGSTTLTVAQLASHTHKCNQGTTDNGSGRFTGGGDYEGVDLTTYSTGGSKPHTHNLSGASGEAQSLPPYYALALIMRCA